MNIKYILILLFLGLAVRLSAQDEFNPDNQLAELTRKKENIGITAGYSIDGEIEWIKSEGFVCEDSNVPFSTKTLTRIASIAKNFTAVAIM